jgi:hypothetical protein
MAQAPLRIEFRRVEVELVELVSFGHHADQARPNRPAGGGVHGRDVRVRGHVGMVGFSHDVQIPGDELLFSLIHLQGGPSPVRRFLPEHMELIGSGVIQPGRVFDLTLPLDDIAEGYRAMDERRAIKTLLTL